MEETTEASSLGANDFFLLSCGFKKKNEMQ